MENMNSIEILAIMFNLQGLTWVSLIIIPNLVILFHKITKASSPNRNMKRVFL